MTVFRNDDAWDRSNVWFEEGNIRRYSKTERLPQMRYIDYGLTVCSQPIFENYPAESRLIWRSFSKNFPVAENWLGYEVHERFYEIGSHEGLEELDRLLRGRIAKSRCAQTKRQTLNAIMTYSEKHLAETVEIAQQIDSAGSGKNGGACCWPFVSAVAGSFSWE